MLDLSHSTRLSATQALALPFFAKEMQLRLFRDGAIDIKGARDMARVSVGLLAPEELQYLREDECWTADHGWSWDAEKGTTRTADRKRMKIEPAAAPIGQQQNTEKVKIQVTGYCGEQQRKQLNGCVCDRPCPSSRICAWMEAFRHVNEDFWADLDAIVKRKIRSLAEHERGANGTDILLRTNTQWVGNHASIQLERSHEHLQKRHFDGGAACLGIVLTLWGARDVALVDFDEGNGQESEYLQA